MDDDSLKQTKDGAKELLKGRLKQMVRERMGVTGGWHPLSFGQEALWFQWKLAPESWAYSIVLPAGVRGPLDPAAFRRALQRLSDRHPCLRTEFREEDGVLRQRARPHWPVDLAEVDAEEWDEDRLDEAVRAAARRPFDLASGAALRAVLFRRSPERHVLVLALHHIVADLWSLIVLMDELRLAYGEETGGAPAALPEPALTFEDVVRSERRALSDESRADVHSHLRYWRETLRGPLPVLDLPTDRPRPPRPSFRGATLVRRLDPALTERIEALAASSDSTPFMVLLAAYQVLLHRYSGQDDVVVGTPTSGRNAPGLAGIVGDLVNMVPIRTAMSAELSFRECVAATREAAVGALKHQDCPFSAIVDAVRPARDASRPPIFQTTFVLQKFHLYPELQRTLLPGPDEAPVPFADLRLEPIALAQQDGQFDINLEMKKDEAGRLVGAWKYAADLFDSGTVAGMAGAFETLLAQMVADPDRAIGSLRLLDGPEAEAAIAAGRGADVPLPEKASVWALFDRTCGSHGAATAIVFGDESVTYAELAARVDSAALGLASLGIGRESLVAVAMPRGIGFVTALLAIGRCGGAFLPLDPRSPPARIGALLAAADVALVVADDGFPLGAEATGTSPVAMLKDLAAGPRGGPLPPPAKASDLAYVMFTSGSTGEPKGAMVEHRGMVNHVLAKLSDLGFGPGDSLAQNAPPSFDVVVWQSLAPLVAGGRVVVVPDEAAADPAALIAEIGRRGLTLLQVVPSMMRALIEEAESHAVPPGLAPLRWMIPTGEALPTELCRRWFDLYPAIPILNTYGSTECSDDQCHYRLDRLASADSALPIVTVGRAIPNMAAHVLDSNLAPVPPGVVGEIYIGGIGVGRGYRGDSARTDAAFVASPYGAAPGERLYRTRDMARRRADGLIDFLGRTDQMIKLNGLRIEPGEIETALCRHPDVAEAAVTALADEADERRLVAYVVAAAGSEVDPGVLRRFLAADLPHSMIPALFVALPQMPLTANGKLDQRGLPAPDWGRPQEAARVAPRTPVERTIAEIWGALLQRDGVSVTEDFFACGGDSIRSIQVAARCRRAGLSVEPVDLFVHRTIEALADHLERAFGRDGPEARAAAPAAPAAPMVAPEQLALAAALVRFDCEDSDPVAAGPALEG
ncbi:MAG TPA: amino acid adenylation domain-containing protein [Allosphingosinicella sp.]|jgi:amino acid adenylation domain-containing protein